MRLLGFRGRVAGVVVVQRVASMTLEALVGTLSSPWACQDHVLLSLVDTRLSSDCFDPLLGALVTLRIEVIVSRRCEQSKCVFGLSLGIFLACNGSEIGQGDLVAQLGLVFVTVDGEKIGAKD